MNYTINIQQQLKKCHAYERIKLLLDKDSFFEIGELVCGGSELPYDGVITGIGTIDQKNVCVFSQDFTIHGGTIGLEHGKKIANLYKKAIQNKCPIIGIYDSAGARIEAGADSLNGCGEMLKYATLASGYIPNISVVLGSCVGAAAYMVGVSDFVFCVNSTAKLFITGASVIESVTGEKCDVNKFGKAWMHSVTTGVVHIVCDSEKECLDEVQKFISYLPAWCGDDSKYNFANNDKNNTCEEIKQIIPYETRKAYNVISVIRMCVDEDSFYEVHASYATSVVIGFAKMQGGLVGIVANQPDVNGGVLDCESSCKAARFVRFCDAFNIPIITFVDTPGYLPGLEEEQKGIIRHGAKLPFAYAEATTIMITVVLRKAYGGAYIAMGSKAIGGDYILALPNAEIAVMGAESAVNIMYKKELKGISNEHQNYMNQKIEEYIDKLQNIEIATKRGYIDKVIEYSDIRGAIIQCLLSLLKKDENLVIKKKHSNIPL